MDTQTIIDNPLYDLEHYALGVALESDERELVGCYVVINKHTGVCEMASPVLPEAVGALTGLDKQYPQLQSEIERITTPKIFEH